MVNNIYDTFIYEINEAVTCLYCFEVNFDTSLSFRFTYDKSSVISFTKVTVLD